jgi:hypothetical protein
MMCMKFHDTGSNPYPLFLCVVIFQSGSLSPLSPFSNFLCFHFISGYLFQKRPNGNPEKYWSKFPPNRTSLKKIVLHWPISTSMIAWYTSIIVRNWIQNHVIFVINLIFDAFPRLHRESILWKKPDQTFILLLVCTWSVLTLLYCTRSVRCGKKIDLWNNATISDQPQFSSHLSGKVSKL